ncbi:calcium-binding protein [Agromyces humi]|uniref:calcium-binding protein n=1 Tax=Agromyces humi TaxID=1766800 RepID=UPI001939833F|nr:calcium-binding protein [Agromyces humi]
MVAASVNASIVTAGHSVRVWAIDDLQVLGIAGAIGGGFVGGGGSVLVLNIRSRTDAAIGSTAVITAGGGASDEISVRAIMVEDSLAFGLAAGGGFVGIGGQVAVIKDTGSQRAHVDGGAELRRAGLGVLVESSANRTLNVYSIGVAVGAGAVGFAIASVSVAGDNRAETATGTVAVGAAGTVGRYVAKVTDHVTIDALAISLAGGAIGIGGVITFVDLSGTAAASAAPVGTIGTGGVSITADGDRHVTVKTLNVTIGAFALGVTVARSNSSRNLEAVLRGATSTAGPVIVRATADNEAAVVAPGGGGGGVSVQIQVVFAVLSGHTLAEIAGNVLGASSITVEADAENRATADTFMGAIALIGISGAWASTEITTDAWIRALVSSGTLSSTGTIRVTAKTHGDGNLAKSIVDAVSGGLIDLKAMIALADVDNEVRASMNGAITSAGLVQVTANAHGTAEARVLTAAVALASLAVGIAHAEVTSAVSSTGAGSIAASGADVSFIATSVNSATAVSNVMTIGAFAGIAVGAPIATIAASTTARWDGTITAARNVTIEADAANTVYAKLNAVAAGLAGVNGGEATAKITNATVTSAIVGDPAEISGVTQKLMLYAHAVNRATAVSGGIAAGGVSISTVSPTAIDQAVTKAELDGDVGTTHIDPAVGKVGDAGALLVEVKAIGDDATNASVDSFSAGILAVNASTAEANTAPTVSARLGGGEVTATQTLTVLAQSLTDADSFANATTGGLISITAGFTAKSVDKPTVAATVTGGFAQAGGLLSLTARHGAALATLSDGTILAINCNGADTICFALPHGIDTGSTVTYSAPASTDPAVEDGTIPNPNAIAGLGDGRTYGVIKVDDTTLRLGVQFNAAGVVSVATATLHFPGGHNLRTGDTVVYNCNGGGALGTLPVSGLTCGNSYYVYAVDEFDLRLSTTPLTQAGSTVVSLVNPDVTAGSIFTVGSTAGLDGRAVVYHAPATIDFKSSLVDIHTDGDGKLDQSSGVISHTASWNTIYAPSHGAIDDSEWIYTVTGGPAIGGLFNGQHVWIVLENVSGFGAGDHMIRLADSACHAGIGTYDPTPGGPNNADNNTPCSTNIQIIALLPDTSVAGLKADHRLRRVGYESIGLVEGRMYFIDVLNGTQFQLLDAAGTVQTGLVDKLGTHRLVDEGIATVSGGTGTQQLYLDLPASALVGTPHVLIGVGGPGALLADLSGSVNGVPSATSTGIGGGGFDFKDVFSEVDVRPTVTVDVQGGLLRGGAVKVNGTSYANAAVSSVAKGGGFVGFGAANANADVVNTVTVTLADGASIFSSSDVEITAVGFITANGEGVNRTGGLISGADTDIDLELGFNVATLVAGDIFANRTVLVDAAAGFDATASASSGSGGLGTNADANDDSGQGVQIGHDHAASVSTTVAGTGSILGGDIQLSAAVGRQYTVNSTNGDIQGSLLEARGIARSTADAYALGADSDAGAYVKLNSSATVSLLTNASVEGADIFIRAAHENLNLQADANADCGCGGGDTDARADVSVSTTSSVVGADESVLRTSGLHVAAYQYFSKLYVHAHRSGGLFDFGSADATLSYAPARDILWESTVYLLGEPNPILIVDASGTIIAKTDNVTVRASEFGPALGIGDTIGGGTIWIDPILYDEQPEALFEANHPAGCTSSCNGVIHGTQGMFLMQETWNTLLIRNSSDKAIFIKGTAGTPSQSINTLNSHLTTTPEATINVSVDNGPHAPPATLWFWKVEHIFPATDVVIESLRDAATTGFDLTIDGDIVNTIGSLRIANDRGSILRGADAGSESFFANRVTLDSELGSIGTVAQPITLVLVQITHTGEVGIAPTLKLIHLDAEAGVDLFLDVTTVRRDSLSANTAPLNPVISSIKAGHDAVVILRDSGEGIAPAVVGDVNVQIFTPDNLPGDAVLESVPTTCYFRPDGPGCSGGVDAPVIVGGQVVLVAFGTDLSPRKSNYTFSDIRAGHNIAIFHPSSTTELTVTAYTDVDATWSDDETGATHGLTNGSGKIDVLTNGSIVVVEQSSKGDLRVGHIHATGLCTGAVPTACGQAVIDADVTLRSPRMILDAELDAGVIDTDDDRTCVDAYDLDCAAGTPNGVDVTGRNITLYAGDNLLGEPGSASGTGGIGLPGNFLEIQVNAVGGPLGDLDAYDTAADDDKTAGIYIDQVAGDLQIGIVHTEGDDPLSTGNVSLRSRAGSILDAQNDAAADVIGQTIDIDAHGGSIGTAANDLEIDSLVDSPFACTNANCANNPNGTSDAGLAAIADDVALEASAGIWLTETDGYLRLLFAHATAGNIRITVRESAELDEDLYLIRNGSANFAEDNSTVPGNNPDHLRDIPNGTVFAEQGSVELRVGDDVTLHQNSQILADLSIDIRGDFGNLDTNGTLAVPDPEHGTTMILRGRIIADCVVTLGGTSGYPVGTCAPSTANPVAGRQTNVWGGSDVDLIDLGDPSGLDLAQTTNPALNKEQLGDPGYIFFGSKTTIHGNATLASGTADGEDRITVWYLQSMNVVTSPTGLQTGTGAGHTLNLDGQGESDFYAVYTNGSHGNIRNYVINVLDTGAPDAGVDELAIYGYDNLAAAYNGYLPGTTTNAAADDIFLLRALKCIDNESPFALSAGVPSGCLTPTEIANHPAFIALLAGSGAADGGIGSYRDRIAGNEPSSLVQRINYDTAINGRISVFGQGGNDAFYVDDTTATITLDGGAGNDTFQIGQIFGTQRDGQSAPDGGALLPGDTFPSLVPTTRGWLSPGTHAPLLATGGTGNDRFTVYSNQAEIQLNGDDHNDLFVVRAFAIAAVCDTNADNIAGCGLSDVDYRPANGVFPMDAADGADDGKCVLAGGYIRFDNNNDNVCNNADAHLTFTHLVGSNIDLDHTMWEDDVIPLDANGVAVPVIGLGFSTSRPLDIRAGGGEDEVQYNVNAPVNVDGGTGFDKLVILGTEFADDFAITDTAIYGGGLNVKYTTVEIVEIDGLEGDDQFFVQSTAYGVAYRVIGGLGSDLISVTGDVTADIVTRELEGLSGAVDHIVTAPNDPGYDGLPTDGVPYNVATGEGGIVVIREHTGGTAVREGALGTEVIKSYASYTVELAVKPTANVYVTVSAAWSPSQEANGADLNPAPLADGIGDTVWLCIGTADSQCDEFSEFQRHKIVNGVVVDENGRAVVLTFTTVGDNWKTPQRVYLWAVDDPRAEGDRIVVIQHSVISDDLRFNGAAVRQVNALVYDNDTPGVYAVPVTPGGSTVDGRTIVIEGSAATERTDDILLSLAKKPAVGDTIWVRIWMDADSQRLITLDFSAVPAARWQQFSDGNGGTYYAVSFDSTNWNVPVRIKVHARNNSDPGDPLTAVINYQLDTLLTTPAAAAAYPFPNLRSGPQRTDVLVYDDETPNVVSIPTGTDTVIVKCGNEACTIPGGTDGYTIRLTKAPNGTVTIALITDGLVDVVSVGGVAVTPAGYQVVGGDIPSRRFLGNLSFAGSTVTRANGSDLGSFVDEGFVAGQRIRISSCGVTVYTIVGVPADGKSLVLNASVAGCGSGTGASINLLTRSGIWDGTATTEFVGGSWRLVRPLSGSWLADGFLEGQWVQICQGATCIRAKIAVIRGDNAGHDEKLELRAFGLSGDSLAAFLSGGQFSVVRIAAVVTFVAAGNDFAAEKTIELAADVAYHQPLQRQGVKIFPSSTHLVSKLRGPLAVEGGVTGADRSLELGLKLPGEQDGPLFAIATQAPETKQIDMLNIYNDSSQAHGRGAMNSTSLTGFGMAKALDFGASYGGAEGQTFGEPQVFPGGISYGTVQFVDGKFVTNGAKSSIEIFNLMLGVGNDRFDIQGTLQPDDAVKLTGTVVLAASAGQFGSTHRLSRQTPFDWKAQGFLVGMPVTISGMTGLWKVVGFGDDDPGDTTANTVMYLQLLSGSAATGTVLRTIIGSDVPVTTTTPVVITPNIQGDGGTVTRSTGSWAADGFVVGQLVMIQGLTGQWRLMAISADGKTLTLQRGDVIAAPVAGPTTVFVPGPHGGITAVHGGGNSPMRNSFDMVRSLPGAGAPAGTALVLTRLDGLPWGLTPFLAGSGYVVGNPYGIGPQHIQLAGESFTRMILGFGNAPCPYADPFPHCGEGTVMYLSGPVYGGPLGAVATTVHVAKPAEVTVTAPIQVHTDFLVRTDAGSFAADGFKVGMQVRISGMPGAYTIKSISADGKTMTFWNVAFQPTVALNAAGVAVWSAPLFTVTGYDPLRDGGLRIGGDLITVCNLVNPIDGVACDLEQTAGPNSPLVVYGDTSQDGVWYSGHPSDVLGMEFGPKPFDPFTHIPDAENEDDEWMLGLAHPHDNAGNDIIDASGLFAHRAANNLPTVGFSAYGGLGDDLIIGSQAGDHLAGGSGDDEIRGLRGVDHIYGDSGMNVNLFTRALDIAVTDRSPKPSVTGAGFLNNGTTIQPYPSPVRDDLLVAGRDLLFGDGVGTVVGGPESAYDDIVFGDHGAIVQNGPAAFNTADPNLPDPRLQRIQTTAVSTISSIESRNLQRGSDDAVFGGLGRDVLIGGAGHDSVDGDEADDLVFGDNVVFVRTPGDWTSPRFQTLCGTLLYSRTDRVNACGGVVGEDNSGLLLVDGTPRAYRDPDGAPWWAEYDVANLFHTFAFDEGTSGAGSFGNDDLAGGQAHDVVFGQLGNDTIQGDGGIDGAFARMTDDPTVTWHVGASRTPLGCVGAVGAMVCDYTGVLVVVPSFEAATDGEDYLEGNAGNDRIFGNLGQDDIVGGSSDFFSLVTPDLRPDGLPTPGAWYGPKDDRGADLLFGGAGTRIGIDNQVSGTPSVPGLDGGVLADNTLPADMDARDADTIVADNGRIIRIVGTNHLDVNPSGTGQTQAGQPNHVTFNYDIGGTQRLVVRGVHLLDYTVGGPDFVPQNFGLPIGADCNGSPTQPTCSTILDTTTGSWKLTQIGGRDEVHGETGDDTVYTGADHDVIYGDAQNDDLIGGWGNDWISGGTGSDGVLGDDGRIFTSRNTGCSVASSSVCNEVAEPLYGILKFRTVDPDTKTSQGDVLGEFISTPGQVQTATINVAGQLVKAADLTVYNLGPNENMSQHQVANQPTFDANNSDDIIFGGWGGDWIHGGAGDDAISGAEAIGVGGTSGYAQHFDGDGDPIGLELIDFAHPWNPGDVLHFGADTNAWHSNNHNEIRLGEFLLYDEYDPRRVILFNGDGTVWKGGTAPWSRPFFLNNEVLSGNWVTACIAVDNQGNCTGTKTNQPSDGDDVLFGDLGNDWSVGGTGQDTLWPGWGNDLSNADDDLTTNGGLNDAPDGVNSSYQDRVYGGAGLDILIGNTGGDRLIDWVGEFNTYLVPFAPFGIATVSRQVEPQLPLFLYALSRSQGADPTRATDTGEDPARNGEPYGELGLITQHDHGQWQTQTGGPTDPQAGNIPGGRRDTLRGADFNDGTTQGFATDSGTFSVQGGVLKVTAAGATNDAVAVWYSDAYKSVYYELSAKISMDKATGGWKANAYIVFDYFGPFDFKFAGIDESINKMVIGHRNASGWWVDAQGVVPGGVRSGKYYVLNVVVNGLIVTVTIDGGNAFSHTFAPRVVDGDSVALNKGLVGFGSQQARGWFDNIALTVISPAITVDRTEAFDGASAAFTPVAGTWSSTPGRITGMPGVDGLAAALVGYTSGGAPAPGGTGVRLDPMSYLEVEAVLAANGYSGIVFDWYANDDFKFVALDVAGKRIVVGHVSPRGGWVVDASVAKVFVAGRDYRLNLVLKRTVVTITLDGQVITSYAYNSPLADGQTGVFGRGVGQSFDAFRFRTDDAAFTGAPAQGTASSGARVAGGTTIMATGATTTATDTTTTTMATTTAATTTTATTTGTATAAPQPVAPNATSPFSLAIASDGGVSFTATGANNRDFFQVRLVCSVAGTVTYSTTLVLQVGADGVGTTQVVHPPAGDCVATLEIPKGGGKVRVLETLGFVAV